MTPCNSNYTQLSHTFNRVIEEYREHLRHVELTFAQLGECERYHYDKKGESIVVIYIADGQIVVNVDLYDKNVVQAPHIFNNKMYNRSPEGKTLYRTLFIRVIESEEELMETMKRFFEI